MPTDDLQRALAAYQSGDLSTAAAHLDDVLDGSPTNADGLMLAGLVANRRGQPEASIAFFDRAVSADPDHDGAWCNRAAPLAQLGRFEQAEHSLRRALTLRLTPQAAGQLLRVLVAQGRASDAAAEGRALLDKLPDHPLLCVLTGQALLQSDRPTEAMAPLSLALRQGRAEAAPLLARALRATGRSAAALSLLDRAGIPVDPDGANLRGLLHQDLGQSDAAEAAFRDAIQRDPDHGPAHHNLATALFQSGRADEALKHHRAALAQDPDDHARWVGLVDSLGRCVDPPHDLAPQLAHALLRPGLARQGLERAVRKQADANPEIQRFLADSAIDDAVLDALDVGLIRAWWTRTRVLGPVWERALTRLRRAALLDDALRDHPDLMTALAAQAWHTELAWSLDATERAALAQAPIHLQALYRSCREHPGADRLAPTLYRLHVEEPAEEQRLAAELPSLAQTQDATSAAVRAQYEENPYPRLLSVHRKPALPLPDLVRALLPHVTGVPSSKPLRVLIAGCGTGQQILGATRYAHAEITALDLSRASLGVAARQVRSWELQDRVFLAQADLLALTADALTAAGRPRRFEVIECGGVLHHLADPLAGWRRLVDLLAPSGLMKIALYSEAARTDVIAASAIVADLPMDADGLRASRARLLALPRDHPAHPIVWSVDFPSLSGFRDLVRHACEHRFTLPQLAAALDELGLEFLGFQHPDPRARAHYAARFPGDDTQRDLGRWEIVESAHPECFVGMYQFWCRRRG